MIIDKKVYDVTKFLDEHPGGEDVLLDSSGQDATQGFEDVGHSAEARAQLKELFIGEVREATEEEKQQAKEEAAKRGETLPLEASNGGFAISIAKWLLPLVIIGIALMLRKYTASVSE